MIVASTLVACGGEAGSGGVDGDVTPGADSDLAAPDVEADTVPIPTDTVEPETGEDASGDAREEVEADVAGDATPDAVPDVGVDASDATDADTSADGSPDVVEPEGQRVGLTLLVVGESGRPASRVRARVGDRDFESEGPRLDIEVQVRGAEPPFEPASPVEVSAAGHASRFVPETELVRAIDAALGSGSDAAPLVVMLAGRDQRRTFIMPRDGDALTVELDGVSLGFVQGSVVDALGAPHDGMVVVEATRVLRYAEDLRVVPVPFVGTRTGGERVELESFGMVDVVLTTLDGRPLRVASDVGVVLAIEPPWDMTPELGDTVPAWSVDGATGLWTEEGLFTYDPDTHRFVTRVTHFSWWNVDKPIEQQNCVLVTVTGPGGGPVEGATVTANGHSYFGASSALTDADGRACVGLMRFGTAHIEVTHPDFEPARTDTPVVADAGPARCSESGAGCKAQAMTLVPAVRTALVGVVRHVSELDGLLPVDGAEVLVVFRVGPSGVLVVRSLTSDASGRFCTRVPLGDNVEVFASHPEYGSAIEWATSRADPVDCPSDLGGAGAVDVELVLGTARADACIDLSVWPPWVWDEDGLVTIDLMGRPVRFFRGDVWSSLEDVPPVERCARGLGPETWGEVIAEMTLDDGYDGNSDQWVATGCIEMPVAVQAHYSTGTGTVYWSVRPDDWSLFVGDCEDYQPASPAVVHDCRWRGGLWDLYFQWWGDDLGWSTTCGESSCLELSLWGVCGSDSRER